MRGLRYQGAGYCSRRRSNCLNQNGNLAAVTSTGGLTNKNTAAGDTPLVIRGTSANNHTCAVSCAGQVEEFIRSLVACDISCLIGYKGLNLQEACRQAMQADLPGKRKWRPDSG